MPSLPVAASPSDAAPVALLLPDPRNEPTQHAVHGRLVLELLRELLLLGWGRQVGNAGPRIGSAETPACTQGPARVPGRPDHGRIAPDRRTGRSPLLHRWGGWPAGWQGGWPAAFAAVEREELKKVHWWSRGMCCTAVLVLRGHVVAHEDLCAPEVRPPQYEQCVLAAAIR